MDSCALASGLGWLRHCMYVRTYNHMQLLLLYSITVAIGQVTGVRLTCEPVGLINWCNATWQVSNSLLYVATYVRICS